MSRFANRGYRGRALEGAIVNSQKDIIRIDKMEAGTKFVRGGGTIQLRGPVDFVGEVCVSGRAIHFDAKQSDIARGFRCDMLKPHQLAHLQRHAEAKAICGVLAECTAETVAAYFWIGVDTLSQAQASKSATIPWTDAGVTRLGGNKYLIDFLKVPAIVNEYPF